MDYDKILNGFLIFLFGGIVGAVSTAYFLKDYYKDLSDQEIEDVRKMYESRINSEKKNKTKKNEEVKSEKDYIQYSSIASDYSQTKKGEQIMAEKEHPVDSDKSLPYIIGPEDFDDPGIVNQTLTCYFDPTSGVVLDDITREEIGYEDLGAENLELFAKSSESTMYIRNDSISTDFEVIKAENIFEGYEA